MNMKSTVARAVMGAASAFFVTFFGAMLKGLSPRTSAIAGAGGAATFVFGLFQPGPGQTVVNTNGLMSMFNAVTGKQTAASPDTQTAASPDAALPLADNTAAPATSIAPPTPSTSGTDASIGGSPL